MTLLIAFAAVVALALLAYYLVEMRRDAIRERLFVGVMDGEAREVSLWKDAADLLQIEALQDLLAHSPLARALQLRMRRANLRMAMLPFVFLVTVGAAVSSAIVYLLFPQAWASLVAFLAVPVLTWLTLSAFAAWRVRALEMQLPAFVTQTLTTLAAGGTPLAAVRNAAQNSAQPLAGSMAELVTAMELGVPPVQAWRDWAEHWDSPSCRLLSTGVRIKWEAGGEMSQILSYVLDLLEGRRRMELRIETLTSQAKFSSIILISLPFVIGFITYAFNPGLFDEMLIDPLGRRLVIGAGLLMVVGFFWMRRIARLET